ncbi:MAG TPA: sulfatase-like hydrolase/transferase, partial [Thermoanaerobaculia bacterium]|nr:sulfatase-like hydrolase/transferase [Thermoanaerobaculia bacterium]
VIIISIDTLRADHLPAYGYKDVETPAIDGLRKDAILFQNAYSTVPLTFPSHTAMLTGLLPPDNKVRNNIGYTLDPALPTIPSALKRKGYDTGAAISAYVLRGNAGLARAFDFYDDDIVSKANVPVGTLQRSGFETAAVAKRWIGEHKERPFFFMLHLFEPHSPYEPIEPFQSKFRNPYDGEIATADRIVGEFLSDLKQQGIYDKAVVILMSDHGEGLNQHGEPEHGIFVYREDLHVPLLVKLPGGARGGETDAAPVSLIDIFPTVAELTGAEPPPALKGKSLLHHDAKDSARRVYAESLYPRIHLGWSELRTLVGADYQFIQAPKPELYDLAKDPAETNNVFATERRTYASMRDELGAYGAQIELPTHIDPEEAKKLAALGYLSSSAPAQSGPLADPKDGISQIAEMIAATRLMHEGKLAEAVTAFRAILEKNPRLSDAWNQLGEALETSGRLEEAAAAYRKAIELTPELATEFGMRLGAVLLKLDRLDEAAEHARLGEKTNPGGAHLLLARVALARKDWATAQHEAQVAAADRYTNIAGTVLLAQIYAQQNRPQEALTLVQNVSEEAVRRKLGPVETLEFVRGDALARQQRFDEALTAFRAEVANFPHNRQAYASMYVIYMLTGRPAEARASLEALAAANPNKSGLLAAAKTAETIGDRALAEQWRARAQRLR